MTAPRASIDREIYGILGRLPHASKILRYWNARFRACGRDAVMDRYPATPATLHERLSEMFHFDRRGYIVAPPLQESILPLLDVLDDAARAEGRADTVTNEGGVLWGGLSVDDEKRASMWKCL